MIDAPDEVGTGVAFITAPPLDFVPEPVRGQPVVGVIVCYAGDPEAGREVLAPLLEFGPPAEDATAFGQRTAPCNIHLLGVWADPADDDANIAFTREISTVMKPWSTGRFYLSFIGDEGPGRVEAAYGPERYARLQRIKRVWDPHNLFRHNQNIPPAMLAQRTGEEDRIR